MQALFNSSFVRVYIVPGCVFQSVMIAGGYGTGREVVEYFTSYGVYGGTLALAIAYIVMAVILAVVFEIARLFSAYDYHSLTRVILGRYWFLFEIILIPFLLIILAVLGAASGKILLEQLHLPYWAGTIAVLAIIAILTFYGREMITRVLTIWSVVLYAVIIIFLVKVMNSGISNIVFDQNHVTIPAGWQLSGFKFAVYNVVVATLILYVTRVFKSRKEAVGSGFIAAFIALAPATMLHIAFLAAYPEIVSVEVPAYWMIDHYQLNGLLIIYSVMLFGTFVETGAGILQGVNDRIDVLLIARKIRKSGRKQRALISVGCILLSATFSTWGIIKLIAVAYSAFAWALFLIFVAPLMTVGIYKSFKTSRSKSGAHVLS